MKKRVVHMIKCEECGLKARLEDVIQYIRFDGLCGVVEFFLCRQCDSKDSELKEPVI